MHLYDTMVIWNINYQLWRWLYCAAINDNTTVYSGQVNSLTFTWKVLLEKTRSWKLLCWEVWSLKVFVHIGKYRSKLESFQYWDIKNRRSHFGPNSPTSNFIIDFPTTRSFQLHFKTTWKPAGCVATLITIYCYHADIPTADCKMKLDNNKHKFNYSKCHYGFLLYIDTEKNTKTIKLNCFECIGDSN